MGKWFDANENVNNRKNVKKKKKKRGRKKEFTERRHHHGSMVNDLHRYSKQQLKVLPWSYQSETSFNIIRINVTVITCSLRENPEDYVRW